MRTVKRFLPPSLILALLRGDGGTNSLQSIPSYLDIKDDGVSISSIIVSHVDLQ